MEVCVAFVILGVDVDPPEHELVNNMTTHPLVGKLRAFSRRGLNGLGAEQPTKLVERLEITVPEVPVSPPKGHGRSRMSSVLESGKSTHKVSFLPEIVENRDWTVPCFRIRFFRMVVSSQTLLEFLPRDLSRAC